MRSRAALATSVGVCPPAVLPKFAAAARRSSSWRRVALQASALESVLLPRRLVCGELAASAVLDCMPASCAVTTYVQFV